MNGSCPKNVKQDEGMGGSPGRMGGSPVVGAAAVAMGSHVVSINASCIDTVNLSTVVNLPPGISSILHVIYNIIVVHASSVFVCNKSEH